MTEENLLEERTDEDLAVWAGEPLPKWIQDLRVKQILEQDQEDSHWEPVDMNRTAGPAVLWGLSTLVGLTYFLAALPVVGTYIARCPAEERSNEFANYPEVLLWIIFFVPLMTIVLLAQWKVSTYTLVPMIQQIRKRKCDQEEMVKFPFIAWFIVSSVLTVFNLLDQMTNALFTAKTWATRHCYGYQFIATVWQETLSGSLAARLLFLDKIGLDFAEFTAVTYALQLIIQPVVALCYSLPMKWCVGEYVDYDVVMDRRHAVAQYKTFSDDQRNQNDLTDHGTAAIVLAEVNRMEAVVANDMAYRRALCRRIKTKLRSKLDQMGDGKDEEAEQQAVEEMLDQCLEVALAALGRGMARFCLKGLLQNAVQVNLQVSMAAISKTVLHGGIDLFNAFTIGTTILSMFFDIPDMVMVFQFANEVMCEVQNAYTKEGCETSQLEEALSRKVRALRFRIKRLKVYAVLYGMLASLAMMKLVFAVFICKYGTWNLSSIDDGNLGCAEVVPDLNVSTCPVAEYMCLQ